MAGRVAILLNSLRESQLLGAKQVEELAGSPLARGDDPTPLARELVKCYGLTSFQVNQLLRGRGKGLVVGPYRLLDWLGEGGMGQVFKAFHQPMNRLVALKVIRKELLANPQAVGRFYQEIRATAQLAHPNVVLAHDAGQVGETHYFAMEYVEGTDLAKLIKERGPLPVAEACEYIRQAALGLQHAHERRLVHRDIKPSNLLVTRGRGSQSAGLVKILDMGLARLSASGDETVTGGLTQAGTLVGTPQYLAPEQARNSRGVDIRADLYSLGCTFFYLLTGQPPFTGAELTEILLKHQMDPFPEVTAFRKDVPPEVQSVLRKLTAKKPEDRYQTPAELVAALTPFALSGDGVGQAGNAPARRTVPTARQLLGRLPRKAVYVGAAVLGGVLLLALAVALFTGSRSSPSPTATAGPNPTSATRSANSEAELFAYLAREIKAKRLTRTDIAGGFFDKDVVEDTPPEAGLLIGFEIGLGKLKDVEWISSLRPIYLTEKGEVLGRQYGKTPGDVTTCKAKKGYAVGSVTVSPHFFFGVGGLSMRFIKVGTKGLRNDDSYASSQFGGTSNAPSELGDGAPVVGIAVKKNGQGDLRGLGLIALKSAK